MALSAIKKAVTAALALVLLALAVAIFAFPREGVRAYSIDKRIKIYDATYFPGTNFDYVYVPLGMQLKYQSQKLLKKIGITSTPWRPVIPLNMSGVGPALLLCGEIEVDQTSRLKIVTGNGEDIDPLNNHASSLHDYRNNRFVWYYALFDWKNPAVVLHLTNGTYRIRYENETNDLALIRVQ